MGADKNFDVLIIGFEPGLVTLLSSSLSKLKVNSLTTRGEVEHFLEHYQIGAGSTVFVSTAMQDMPFLEVAQAFSSLFIGVQIVFVTTDRMKFQITDLKKNGFSESFLLPNDMKILTDLIDDIALSKTSGIKKRFKAVKLIDLQAGQSLPFEVSTFLPANNKFITLTSSGQLSEKKFEVLKKKSVNSVYIEANNIEKFYEFAAEQMIALGQATNDGVSQTEKSARLQSNVRQLFRSVLDTSAGTSDFEVGRDLLEQSKAVVSTYVSKKTGLDLKGQLKQVLGEGQDSYAHAQSVSTIACLISMATGIGEPEDLAIAGLFHDIGIQGIAQDVSIFDISKLSEDDRNNYKLHPLVSVNLLKEKRITLTAKISDIILKHHERFDGKGFPEQLAAHRIPQEAYLLAYADALEYLSRPKPGQAKLSSLQMHELISSQLGIAPETLKSIKAFVVV
jgi:HD-GYP domain-containing protein (c-di-GMP phosphodiesterase class II)